MILLVGMFIGFLCGLVAAKTAGFVSSWVKLLNTAVAIYVAVYMTPMIAASVSVVSEYACGSVLCALVISVITFLVLNAITMTIMGDLKVTMPRLVEMLGGGGLGFLNGMLVWGFICLLLAISPLAKSSFMQQNCPPEEIEQMWKSSVGTSMAILDFVSFQDVSQSLPKVVDIILKTSQPKPPKSKPIEPPAESEEQPAQEPAPATGS
jgi:uncharacterized membrane protein required for colicin V production